MTRRTEQVQGACPAGAAVSSAKHPHPSRGPELRERAVPTRFFGSALQKYPGSKQLLLLSSCANTLRGGQGPQGLFFPKNKPFIHKRSTKSKALKEKCHFTSKEPFSHLPSFFTPFSVPAQAECPLSPKALTQAQGRGLSSLNRRGRGHGIRKRTWRKCTCVHGAPVFANRA